MLKSHLCRAETLIEERSVERLAYFQHQRELTAAGLGWTGGEREQPTCWLSAQGLAAFKRQSYTTYTPASHRYRSWSTGSRPPRSAVRWPLSGSWLSRRPFGSGQEGRVARALAVWLHAMQCLPWSPWRHFSPSPVSFPALASASFSSCLDKSSILDTSPPEQLHHANHRMEPMEDLPDVSVHWGPLQRLSYVASNLISSQHYPLNLLS